MDNVFRGNKYEVKVLRDYLLGKKKTAKDLFNDFLTDEVDKGNFKYKIHKSILNFSPPVNLEIALQRDSAVCTRCFENVWF
mmetsp:Transcript_23903/g.20871  ORF Transcript_23903/g.20871 Transcript_23903/m.20871 type:complete len:81 (+) Transcript_23903:1181-1423(+)